MIRMFVRHAVSDFSSWKKAYDDFDSERKGMGVLGDAVFPAHDDPNDVTVWHDFASIEAAQSFVGSDRLKEVMAEGGVSSEPQIWFTIPAS